MLENAIRFFCFLSLINASSECSDKTAHYYKFTGVFVNVAKNVKLANCCQKALARIYICAGSPDPSLFDCGYIRHVWSRADSYLEIETYF